MFFPSIFLYLTLSLNSLITFSEIFLLYFFHYQLLDFFSSAFLGSQVNSGSAGSTSFPGGSEWHEF